MNAKDFLSRLELLLADLPAEERRAALEYYTEYLQDACPQAEDDVCGLLGTPEAVAADIRLTRVAEGDAGWAAGYKGNDGSASFGEYLDDAPTAPQPPVTEGTNVFAGEDAPAAEPQAFAGNTGAASKDESGAPVYREPVPQEPPKSHSGTNWLPWLLLAVFTCPLWLGLAGGLLGIIGGAIGILIAIVVAAAALGIGGLGALVAAAPLLATAFGTGLLTMGVALLAAAAGCVLLGMLVWLAGAALPFLFHWIGRLFGWLKGKVNSV